MRYFCRRCNYPRRVCDNAVIYPNPYVVITDKGYTKHYYANSERLATVFGQGGWMTMSSNFMDNLTPYEEDLLFNLFFRYKGTSRPFGHPIISDMPNCDINDNVVQEVQYDCDSVDLVELAIEYDKDILAETMLEYKGPQGSEKDVYYTHNDHLGSAAWITDQDAKPVQYLHYLPYGQLLANQSPSGNDERFKFIGKERDWESGYDYFGARYYISPFLHWMSVDPLSDEDPGISPYAYCSWNPINKIDPDGRDEEQRQLGVAKAWEYVKKNPGNSYERGAKGGPGEKVDCSGLVSNCIVAGEEIDPNRGIQNGVRNIADNTQKIEDMNDLVAGNLVTFNTGGPYGDYSHIGYIINVKRDKNGNVVDFDFIHSGSKGPSVDKMNTSYWKNIVTGFYKWDTRPDTYQGPTLPQVTVLGDKPNIQASVRAFDVKPVSANFNLYIRR